MKIYCLGLPEDTNQLIEKLVREKTTAYAHFSAVGTWASIRDECAECKWHWQTRVPPMVVQWERSSTNIGDFSYNGPLGEYEFAVTERVAECLHDMGCMCSFHPVEYIQPETKRNTVPFPYTGPTLLWCECQAYVWPDMVASGIVVERACSACGDVRYTFKRDGIKIRRQFVGDLKMFRLVSNNWSAATFITEVLLQRLLEARFSNLLYRYAGEIVD